MSIIKKTCSAIVIFVLIMAFFFSYAFTGKFNALADEAGIIDLSENGVVVYSEYSAGELIERIMEKQISDSEKQLLSPFNSVLKFSEQIPIDSIKSVEGETFTVTAQSYTYTVDDGTVIIWNPYSATFGGESVYFSQVRDDVFLCEFTDLSVIEKDQDKIVDVVYHAQITLPKDFVNGYLTYAENYVKNQGPEKLREKYLQDKSLWDEKNSAWQKYQEEYSRYQTDLAEYNEYLVQKKRWENANSAYQNYLEQLKAYNAYLAYLTEYERYAEQLALYSDYVVKYADYVATVEKIKGENEIYFEQMEKVNYILYVVGLINEPMGAVAEADGKFSQRTLYGAVTGSTVTSVLAQRADLDKLGVPIKVIDIAEEATYKLREIFTAYFNYTEDADRYSYYCKYRTDLCNSLRKLFISLEKLERYSTVSDLIKKKEKTEQYSILLSQLSLIVRALDDKPLYNYEAYLNGNISTTPKLTNSGAKLIDEGWKVDGKRTVDTILGQKYIEDFSASCKPPVDVYPQALPFPEEPEKVDCPTPPVVVPAADLPKTVEAPNEPPKEVQEPTKPQEVEQPDVEPTEYVIPEFYQELKGEYELGELTRTPFEYDVDFTLTCQKQKPCGDVLQIVFCDEFGTELYQTEVQKGGETVYPKATPIKDKTAEYVYEFDCWKYSDGTALNLKNIQNGGRVYASYKESLREYSVTFSVDGVNTVKLYHYQDNPDLGFVPFKEYEGNLEYDFVGWDKEIRPVTQDEVYVAVFNAIKIVSDSYGVGDAEITYDGVEYNVTCDFSFSRWANIEKILIYAVKEDSHGDSSSLTVTDSDGFVISFSEECVKTLSKIKACYVRFSVDSIEQNSYVFSLTISDEFGKELKDDLTVGVKLIGNFISDNLALYLYGNVQSAVWCSVSNGELSFYYTVGEKYEYCAKYSVYTVSSEFVSVWVSANSAKAGERVSVILGKVPLGVRVKRIYATDSSGKEIPINDEDLCFVMPLGAMSVTVGVICEQIDYVVSFAWDDGSLIRTTLYKYGDTVEIPTAPVKMSTDKYMYVFEGWDKEITPVTEDVTYYAVFGEYKALPNGIEYSISKILLAEIIGGAVVVIVALIITIVVIKKKKKRKAIKNGEKNKK